MIHVLPFRPEHLMRIKPHPLTKLGCVVDIAAHVYAEVGEGFSGITDEGEVIFCMGRAYEHSVWAAISENSGPHMLTITRIAKRLLALAGPVDALICDFPAAHRWAQLLGFQPAEERLMGCQLYRRA